MVDGTQANGLHQKVVFSVWDHTQYPSPPKLSKFSFSLDITCTDFREKIAEMLSYPVDSLEVKINKSYIETGDKTLQELGIGSKYPVLLSRKTGSKEEDFKIKKVPDVQIPATPMSTALIPVSGPMNYNSGSPNGISNWSLSKYNKPTEKSSTGFVGLSNQGWNCQYL